MPQQVSMTTLHTEIHQVSGTNGRSIPTVEHVITDIS
jgi:hypothetical protein